MVAESQTKIMLNHGITNNSTESALIIPEPDNSGSTMALNLMNRFGITLKEG